VKSRNYLVYSTFISGTNKKMEYGMLYNEHNRHDHPVADFFDKN